MNQRKIEALILFLFVTFPLVPLAGPKSPILEDNSGNRRQAPALPSYSNLLRISGPVPLAQSQAASNTTAKIQVLPSVITGVAPGGSFTVNITATGTRITGWQFYLNFDSTLLSLQSSNWSVGPVWADPTDVFVLPPRIDNSTGRALFSAVFLGTALSFTGNGTLVSLRFRVNGYGVSRLNLSNTIFTTLVGTTVEYLALIQSDGIWGNIPFFLFANPPTLAPGHGQSQTSTVTVADVDVSGTFNLTISPMSASGVNASLSSDSLTLTPHALGEVTLHVSVSNSTPFGSYSINISARSGELQSSLQIPVSIADLPPVASFTFSPAQPPVGEPVLFDGSSSFDPDGAIIGTSSYQWKFGDGWIGFGSKIQHSYSQPGTYVVTLIVRDDASLRSQTSMQVQVTLLQDDVAVSSVDIVPIATSGQLVTITVTIANFGFNSENVSLTISYDTHLIESLHGISVLSGSTRPVTVNWDTSGVASGTHTISANVILATDQNLSNNSLETTVTLLAPPILTISPPTGRLGTKVLVLGSNFQSPTEPSTIQIIDLSFDDLFLGFAVAVNGQFNFTFDVPLANPGTHSVKTDDPLRAITVTSTFEVLPSPQKLGLGLDVGSVYFPGDIASISILTTLNGVPTPVPNDQLTIVVIQPGRSNFTVTPTAISLGLFVATFTVPRNGPIGTYSILAKAHAPGPLDASEIRDFEVKPAWLAAQGRNLAIAATLTGLVAIVSVAWQRGYLRRREEV